MPRPSVHAAPLLIMLSQDHRSYGAHACTVAPASRQLLVIVCPVCAASVHLKPGEDPNAAYERHARAGVCDPRNYQRVHQKPRCPARGCKEKLTSINTYSCKVCGGSQGLKLCLSLGFVEVMLVGGLL